MTPINYQPLPFENYTVRPVVPGDTEAFLELVNNNRERITAYFPGIVTHCDTVQTLQKHLEERIAAAGEGKYIPLVIEDTTSSKLVGVIQVKDIDFNALKRELGAFVDKEYARKGVMLEALKQVIDYSFTIQGLNKLFLRTATDNTAARRLAEKAGFELEGTFKSDFRTTEGKFIDLVYYGLVKKQG